MENFKNNLNAHTLFVLVFFHIPNEAQGRTTCLACSGVALPVVCDTISRCGDYESCYIDMFITTLGYPRYELGCRDDVYCKSNEAPTVGRRASSTDMRISSSCCKANLCTNKTSNTLGYQEPRGPICYSCVSQLHHNSCNRITVCNRHESCLIRTHPNHPGEFETSCVRSEQCPKTAVHIIGKSLSGEQRQQRDLGCNECCDSDLCNDKCSGGGVDQHPCLRNPCNYGKCIRVTNGTNGIYTCQCPQGYYGAHCEKKQLADMCLSNPCVYGKCEDHGTYHACICQPGYTGYNCEIPPNIHPCSLLACQNSGVCQVSGNNYVCLCPTGYMGIRCETRVNPCASSPCLHGKCQISGSSFTCTCQPGYSGSQCDKLANPCASSPCNHGYCHLTGSNFTCSCQPGYSGLQCDKFEPCSSSPCVNGACFTNGSDFHCACPSGYSGPRCENADTCSPSPCVNGKCFITAGPSYHCACPSGFSGQNCDKVDPCSSSPCVNGACFTNDSDFHCACPSGYSGPRCEYADPCSPSPCVNGACFIIAGSSYHCGCPSGFSGHNCDKAHNPCDSSPCIHGNCKISGSDYKCDCVHGYGGKNCEITCQLTESSCVYERCVARDQNQCPVCVPDCH